MFVKIKLEEKMKKINLKDIPVEGVSHNPEIKKQVMIRKGQIPRLTNFSRAVFKPGQKCDEHQHETMYEVYFVSAGSAKLKVNGKNYRMNKNDCVIIEPKELHSVENDGDEDLVLIYFGIATG